MRNGMNSMLTDYIEGYFFCILCFLTTLYLSNAGVLLTQYLSVLIDSFYFTIYYGCYLGLIMLIFRWKYKTPNRVFFTNLEMLTISTGLPTAIKLLFLCK